MRFLLLVLLLHTVGPLRGQQARLVLLNDNAEKGRMDHTTKGLYELLGVEHFTGVFKLPGNAPHELVLVMRSVSKDSIAAPDTLIDSRRWKRMFPEGAPFNPKETTRIIGQSLEDNRYKVFMQFGNMNRFQRTIELTPSAGYLLMEVARSGRKGTTFQLGEPLPILVLTQPYPYPPPPAEAKVQRYCFGAEEHPAQWPAIYGVPHLYVFELTVLP